MAKDTTALVQQNKVKLRDLLESPKTREGIARVLPRHLDLERMTSLVLLACTQQPKLYECTPASVIRALQQSATLGLEINGPLGHAYLVPYGRECQLIPGYKGLIFLAVRTGSIRSADVRLVYKGEHFEVDFGTDAKIVHRPSFTGSRREDDIVAAYVVFTMPDGEKKFEVMSLEEIVAVRKRSRASGNGPWVTDFGEMSKKTVVKRGLKTVPMSSQLAAAVEIDNRYESGEISGVIPEFDDDGSLSAQVQHRTREKMDGLKQRMGVGQDEEIEEAEWEDAEPEAEEKPEAEAKAEPAPEPEAEEKPEEKSSGRRKQAASTPAPSTDPFADEPDGLPF